MAIDTATKRASAISFGRVSVLPLPVPDGAVGAGDRAHLLRLYSALFPSIYNESVTEALTFADVPSHTAVLQVTVIEGMTFADAPSSVGSFQHSVTEGFSLSDAMKADMELVARVDYRCRPPKTWSEVQSWLHKLNDLLRRINSRLGDLE